MVYQKMIIISLLMSVVCCEDLSLTAEHATCPSNVTARNMLSEIMESSSFYFITESALFELASTNETFREYLLNLRFSGELAAFDIKICTFFTKSAKHCVYERSMMFMMKAMWPYFQGDITKTSLSLCGAGYGDSGCGSYKHLISPCGNITSIEKEPTPRFKKFPSQGKNCEWIITVDEGYVIELTFEYFWTDDCLESCECDYLKIFDVFDDMETERGKFCGVYNKWAFISNSNKVKLAYHLQGYEFGTGFNIVYRGISNSSVKILSEIQHVSGHNGSIELKKSQPTRQVGNLLFYGWVLRTEEYRKLVVQWKVTDACESGIKIEMYDGPSSDHTVITNVTIKEDFSGTTKGSGFQIQVEAAMHKGCLANFSATFSSEEKDISFDSMKTQNHTFNGMKLVGNEEKNVTVKTSTEMRNIYEGFVMKAPVGLYVSLDIRKFVFQGSNQDDCAEEGMVLWDGLPGEGTKYGPYCNNLISLWLFSVPFRIRRGMDEKKYALEDARKTNQTVIIHSSTNVFTVLFYWYSSPNSNSAELVVITKVSDCIGLLDWHNMPNEILNVTYKLRNYNSGPTVTQINITPKPDSCFVLQALPSNKLAMQEYSQVNIFGIETRCKISDIIISNPHLNVCKQEIQYKPKNLQEVEIIREMDCPISPMGFIAKFTNSKKNWAVCVNESVAVDNTAVYFDAKCGTVFAVYPPPMTFDLSRAYKFSFFAPIAIMQNHHYIFHFIADHQYSKQDFQLTITQASLLGSTIYDTVSLVFDNLPFHWLTTWSENVEIYFAHRVDGSTQINFHLVPDTYPLPDPSVDCPHNYTSRLYGYKDYCYEIVPFGSRPEKLTWKTAEEACSENGGTLLTINTNQELQYIKNLFKQHFEDTLARGKIFYIGLITDGKGHRWVDGNPGVVTDWYKRFPKDKQPLPDNFFGDKASFAAINIDQPANDQLTRCTAMVLPNPYMSTNWIKIPCYYEYENAGYICKYKGTKSNYNAEYNVSPDLTEATKKTQNGNITTLLAGTIQCPSEWVYHRDKCYRLITSTQPINTSIKCHDANGICRAYGGSLAVVIKSVFPYINYLLHMFKHKALYGAIWVSDCKIIHTEEPDIYTFFENFTLFNNSSNIGQILTVLCETNPRNKVHKCKKGQFTCEDGTCILTHHICDGQKDCISGNDEQYCHSSGSGFLCEDGSVIPFSKYCDFESDCRDNSDEKNCTRATCSPTELQCENGQCLASDKFNDKVADCLDGSDEKQRNSQSKCTAEYFTCHSGDCIPTKFVDNYRSDCEGKMQEEEPFIEYEVRRGIWLSGPPQKNLLTYENYEPFCPKDNGSNVRCNPNAIHCFPRHNACIYETDKYGYMGGCPDGSHLVDCEKFQCPSLFKCPQSYCIPLHKVCDGVVDCTGGADEAECAALSCPGSFKCRKEGYCLDQSLVCDRIYHCTDSHEDEIFCEFDCPLGCTCIGRSVNCSFNGYTRIPSFSREIRSLVLTGNQIELTNSSILPYQYLGQLKLGNNMIRHLPKSIFMYLINLLTLDLTFNMLELLTNGMFYGLNKLQHLHLLGNPVHLLGQSAFSGLNSIEYLPLSDLGIELLDNETFAELPNLKHLSLANNSIRHLSFWVFHDALSIQRLNLEDNYISDVETKTFDALELLEELSTDNLKFCCFAKHVPACTPNSDTFSSCEDLLANETIRVIIWIIGFLALLGNIFLIVWTGFSQGKTTHSLYIINLGLSDFLMSVYLIIIASADQFYRGNYILFADYWKSNHLCKFAGFLSTVSSQMSVFTLVVITADRLVNIVFPFAGKKLSFRNAVIICVFGWILFIVLSFLPLINLAYFGDSIVKHGVCLLFNISAWKSHGWEYINLLLLLVDLLCFTFIFISYIVMYFNYDEPGENVNQVISNAQVVKQCDLIVATDFICWIPLIFTIFLSLGGTHINEEFSAWAALLILPINSALNPYLYILSTLGQTRLKTKK